MAVYSFRILRNHSVRGRVCTQIENFCSNWFSTFSKHVRELLAEDLGPSLRDTTRPCGTASNRGLCVLVYVVIVVSPPLLLPDKTAANRKIHLFSLARRNPPRPHEHRRRTYACIYVRTSELSNFPLIFHVRPSLSVAAAGVYSTTIDIHSTRRRRRRPFSSLSPPPRRKHNPRASLLL